MVEIQRKRDPDFQEIDKVMDRGVYSRMQNGKTK